MALLEAKGFTEDELGRLNRVRLHQQVLFLSCVLGASGKMLDRKYLKKRKDEELWSAVKFPVEKPPNKDFELWKTALRALVPVGGVQDKLGRWTHPGYKIWDWRYDVEGARLLHMKGKVMDVYVPSNLSGTRYTPNRWIRRRINQGTEVQGRICTVRDAGLAIKAVESTSQLPEDQPMPDSLLEVLREWGSTWMWESLRLFGNEDWIKGAIERSSLVCVTDGSYIRETLPELCSAAFILECSEGTGRIVGSFPESSKVANAYRGELLGLMAIHLILLAANKVWPSLQGCAKVYSDCLGALQKVTTLPPPQNPK